METVADSSLPPELLINILLLAASSSRESAYSLAFVSHSISALTSIPRWRTVALSTEKQVLAFWQILLTAHELEEKEKEKEENDAKGAASPDLRSSESFIRAEEKASEKAPKFPNLDWDLKKSISLPNEGKDPGLFVENLFIELESDRFLTISTRLQTQREIYFNALANALNEESEASNSTSSTSDFPDICSQETSPKSVKGPSWSSLQKIKLSPTRPQSRLSGCLYHLPKINVLSLGAVELSVLSKSLQSISPEELTLVFDGDENVFGQSLTWCSGTLPDEVIWRVEDGRRIPSLGGLRRRLKKLQVIGIDPRSQAPGIQMPYSLIAPLKAGSLLRGSLIHAVVEGCRAKKSKVIADLEPISSQDLLVNPSQKFTSNDFPSVPSSTSSSTSSGITHLRYDTRKFSFRPAEIIVSRLRPFFQEVKPSVSTESEEANQILKSWGLGEFSRLHLSWDSEIADEIKKSRFSSIDSKVAEGREIEGAKKLNGGWPREIKDTWTERSDRDLSPTFSHELAHTFQQTYGWQPLKSVVDSKPTSTEKQTINSTNLETSSATFVADYSGEMGNRLCGNGAGLETEFLRCLEEAVGIELASILIASKQEKNRNPSDVLLTSNWVERNQSETMKGATSLEELKPDLIYGVRSPARLMNLGGKAALSRESRLRLFENRSSGGKGAWG